MSGAGAPALAAGQPVRVLLVDDDPLVRSALGMVLGGASDLAVVGEAADGDEVPAAVAATSPDVVLMDVRMPRVDGLRATETVVAARRGHARSPAVLVLTTFDTDELVLRALRAGAAGFLLKDTPPGQIVEAVRAVARGEASVSPAALRHLVAAVAQRPTPGATGDGAVRARARALLDRLTDREREVAAAVGEGLSNAEVAARLHLSVATVKTHVTRTMQALGVVNRVQVALVVHDAGAGPGRAGGA